MFIKILSRLRPPGVVQVSGSHKYIVPRPRAASINVAVDDRAQSSYLTLLSIPRQFTSFSRSLV